MGSLDDARLKLDRAEFHLNALRTDIRKAGQGEPYRIPLRKELDPDTGDLHYVIGRLSARPEEWGLLLGDALHNFRSALDHGWWQLACKHLGRPPTEEEAKSVQFPILRLGVKWDARSQERWVGKHAAAFVETLQPDPAGYPPDVLHPFVALNRLSNVDKHRNMHPTVERLREARLTITKKSTGQVLLPRGAFIVYAFEDSPKEGDKVLTIPPESILRSPEVKFKANQTGYIAVEGKWDLLMVMDSVDMWVTNTLDGFDRLLAGDIPVVS